MKIAVSISLENESVFDHFGHAPGFKIYDVEDNNVISSKVVASNGMGHTVMVNLMRQEDVNVVLCGWIGGHALDGLKEAGISVYTGATGSADDSLQAYLAGNLEEAEAANCNHDHAEGGCGGGCHKEPQLLFEGKNAGKTVSVHYTGTFNDGSKFDSSYDRGEPLTFICAAGQMIRGFDKAVVEMEVGQEVDIHLLPEEAYGQPDPNNIFAVQIAQLPGSEQLEAGQRVYLQNQFGQPFPVTVVSKDETTIVFDANHEMAGKELNFHIELVSVND